jgi:hypothetical protein
MDGWAVFMRIVIHGNIRLYNEVLVLSIHFVRKETIEKLFRNGEVAMLVGTECEDAVSAFSDLGNEIACVTISAHTVPAIFNCHPKVTLLATTGARIRSIVLTCCKSKHLLEVPWLIKKCVLSLGNIPTLFEKYCLSNRRRQPHFVNQHAYPFVKLLPNIKQLNGYELRVHPCHFG